MERAATKVLGRRGDFHRLGRAFQVGLDGQERTAGVSHQGPHIPLSQPRLLPPGAGRCGQPHKGPCGIVEGAQRVVPAEGHAANVVAARGAGSGRAHPAVPAAERVVERLAACRPPRQPTWGIGTRRGQADVVPDRPLLRVWLWTAHSVPSSPPILLPASSTRTSGFLLSWTLPQPRRGTYSSFHGRTRPTASPPGSATAGQTRPSAASRAHDPLDHGRWADAGFGVHRPFERRLLGPGPTRMEPSSLRSVRPATRV